jgi:plastocyanin
MRKLRLIPIAVGLVVLLSAAVVSLASAANSATLIFGSPDHGSGCVFPCEEDASFHSVDQILPGALAVSAGGTVDFQVLGFHQVAIYAAGTKPKDITSDPAAFPFVNDPQGRIFLGGLGTNESFTFDEPGKYLVICNVAPHFEEAQMWAWVQVK